MLRHVVLLCCIVYTVAWDTRGMLLPVHLSLLLQQCRLCWHQLVSCDDYHFVRESLASRCTHAAAAAANRRALRSLSGWLTRSWLQATWQGRGPPCGRQWRRG